MTVRSSFDHSSRNNILKSFFSKRDRFSLGVLSSTASSSKARLDVDKNTEKNRKALPR